MSAPKYVMFCIFFSLTENEIGLDECSDQLAYCKTLQCPYGVEKVDADGALCPQCECRDPCRNFPCEDDEQCAVGEFVFCS